MRLRSFAARVVGLGLFMSAPAGLQAQTSTTGSILISAHVIAAISDAGLRRSLTPVLGFDYSF